MAIDALVIGSVSIFYVGVLMVIVFYLFALVGNFMFGGNDPNNFGNLHLAMMTLFKICTLVLRGGSLTAL